jgi:hypothetical protein
MKPFPLVTICAALLLIFGLPLLLLGSLRHLIDVEIAGVVMILFSFTSIVGQRILKLEARVAQLERTLHLPPGGRGM